MDYQRIYNQLVSKRQQTLTEGYIEKHHIIPRCMNGSDDPENIVKLTAREHFIAHQLLAKIYPNNRKLIFAADMMSNFKVYSSKKYQWLKNAKSRIGHSEETKLKLSIAHKGKIVSLETKQKMSIAFKGRKLSKEHKEKIRQRQLNRTDEEKSKFTNKYTPRTLEWKAKISPLGRKHTLETKEKMSVWQKGVPKSEEIKNKLRGQKRSEETKLKISNAAKNRVKICCLFCKREFTTNRFYVYHGDKCKFKLIIN